MKILSNTKILAILLIISITLNLLITGIFAYHKYMIKTPETKVKDEIPAHRMMQFYSEELNLSKEQENEFTILRNEFIDSAKNIQQQMTKIREEIYFETLKQTADIALIESKSDSLGILHAKLKVVSSKYFIDMLGKCNETQKPIMKDIIMSIQNTRTDMKCSMNRQHMHQHRHRKGNNPIN